jgi:hypothetical protein
MAESSSSDAMDGEVVEIVQKIHGTPNKAVFYVAGGGVQVLPDTSLLPLKA